jgi:indole-3-glycerol phosphate synthase
LKSYGADGILIGSSILECDDEKRISAYIESLYKALN